MGVFSQGCRAQCPVMFFCAVSSIEVPTMMTCRENWQKPSLPARLLIVDRASKGSAGSFGKIDEEALRLALDNLNRTLKSLELNQTLNEVRGLEGHAAHTYFSVFDHLIVAQKDEFSFQERNRRPPMDNVNCLLSFIYTLLVHDCRSALESVGLDPAVGFLHRDRPGRPGLALDLMEEFRPFFADRLVLSLINLRQVQHKGFKKTEAGSVVMNDETRKVLLVAYQERKQEEILHPFLEEKVSIGMLFHVQALLLARCLRGDLDGYPPFIWK